MKKYKLRIILDDGDEVHAAVEARNCSDALARAKKTRQFIDFVKDRNIVSVDISPIAIKPLEVGRFALTGIKNKKSWYVIADLDNRIKVEFKKGMFNKTRRILPIGKEYQAMNALQAATVMREIADYLQLYFPDLI